ncbi:MAG: c-type cytochrome [Bryobacterales bacterium]|nr:c-type cytochrome [Bryobacterales bacterium]MBV9401018.1 c-type cytochrome [Bryobacterales bacterium]
MKKLECALTALVLVGGLRAQAGKELIWAYPVPDPSPSTAADNAPKKLEGSARSYTQAQIDDQFNPPDWFPDRHGPLPSVVQKGIQAQACGSCHLMSGMGHPESATLAGLPEAYMIRQMEDFKNGLRKDPKIHETSARAARMNIIAAGLPDEEMRKAIEWFAALKPIPWYKVEEAQTVPKSWVNGGRMRLPLASGGTEPLGNRIITMPQDAARVELRDPRSGFMAYVPPGSIKKGEALAGGGSGKTIGCAICHGDGLKGLGDVPRLAGIHPIYIVRQLYNFQTGANSSSAAALMKKVVEKLNDDDMIALAAYAGSLAP